MNKRLNKPIVLSCVALAIIAIIIGSFFDLNIAKAIYNENDFFGKFLEVFGMLPTYYGLCFIGGVIVSDTKKRKYKPFKSLILFGFGASITISGICCAIGEFTLITDIIVVKTLISIILGSVLFILGLKIGLKNENENLWKIIFVMGFVVLIGMVLYTLFFNSLIHRPRYRTIVNPNYGFDLSLYHNWWEPCKEYKQYISGAVESNAFKSCPSGHSAASALSIMFLSYLPYFFPKLKEKKISKYLTLIGVCYMYIVMASRMRLGAHFLSDTAFGSLGALITLLIGNAIIEKIIDK